MRCHMRAIFDDAMHASRPIAGRDGRCSQESDCHCRYCVRTDDIPMAFSRLEDADEALLLFHDPHVD